MLLCALLAVSVHAETIAPVVARELAQSAVADLVFLHQRAADDYFHDGEFSVSVDHLDYITLIDPANFDAYACAAWLMRSAGREDEIMPMYRRLIAAYPDTPETYFEIGVYFRAIENYAEAVEYMKQAVDLGLKSPHRHMYGHLLQKLDRYEEALAFWQQVAAEEPENAVAQREIQELQEVIASPAAAPAPPASLDE